MTDTQPADTPAADPYATWDPSKATDLPDGMPDRAIVPLVEALRARGIVTLQSCIGHLVQGTEETWGNDGTLWVRADSVDGTHIRLFLLGAPFDRVQYVYLPDAPHWEFIWHPDRAAEAVEALGGLLPADTPAPDSIESVEVSVLEDGLCRRVWTAALRWFDQRNRDAENWMSGERLADRIESGVLTPWADTPEPSTPPAQPPAQRRAAAGPPPGTLDGPGVLGRALLIAGGSEAVLRRRDGLWQLGGAALDRATIEGNFDEVREVLLVDPAAGPVLEAAELFVGSMRDAGLAQVDPIAAAVLAAAVDALDRPTIGGETEQYEAVRDHADQQLRATATYQTGLPSGLKVGGLAVGCLLTTDRDMQAFVELPDCPACEGTGKDLPPDWRSAPAEPDEPAEQVLAAFEAGLHGVTAPPATWTTAAEPAPEPAGDKVQVLVTPDGRCGCCSGRGDHPCGHECDSCDGSGARPDSPLCSIPHGADCHCAPEPAGDGPGWAATTDGGPGWDRADVEGFLANLGAPPHDGAWNPDMADQLRALLADRDHQHERRFALNQMLAEAWDQRDAARAELATGRRDAAADALEWMRAEFAQSITDGDGDLDPEWWLMWMETLIAEVRSGTRPVPGSPQPAADDDADARELGDRMAYDDIESGSPQPGTGRTDTTEET